MSRRELWKHLRSFVKRLNGLRRPAGGSFLTVVCWFMCKDPYASCVGVALAIFMGVVI